MSINKISIIKSVNSFSLTEKIVFYIFALIFISTGLGLVFKQANGLFASVPAYGGSLTEGIIGYPRYINPILSITEAGEDLSSLLYAGLLKENPDGSLSPNLAESYTISDDGLVYDVYLKPDLTFHDGEPLRADDILFTINKVKDVNIKSPEYVNWQGIGISKIDDLHVQFILKTPYSPFAYNLTLGILPKHVWENITDDQFNFSSYNYEPIGEGPYEFVEIKRDNDGLPLYYKLKAFDKYASGEPYIQNLTLNFYKDSDSAIVALKNGRIDSLGGMSSDNVEDLKISNDQELRKLSYLRTFSVFFNQSQSDALINQEVRLALNTAVDRKDLIDKVLNGFARPAYSPVPQSLLSNSGSLAENEEGGEDKIERAKNLLFENGWSMNNQGVMEKHTSKGTTTLAFSLTTSNNEDLKTTADILKDEWERLGAKIDVETYDSTSLNQDIIRPRKYQALLFGEIVGHDIDLYPFWHSSQRADPGLNIAMYTNIKADKALENERTATSTEEMIEEYDAFDAELQKDMPAVFLYTPEYIYIVPKKLHGFSSVDIETPKDRFTGIEKRYLLEKRVLKIFQKDT